ncbi:hypothetical protein HY251_20195 [bacterium]|nr:hypothetical protein [bacterium]
MRMLMRVTCAIDKGNEAIKNGTMGKILENAAKEMKPEATYFLADAGSRTAYFFFDMKDSSQMPVFAEPFFAQLNAKVEFQPAMSADDLKAGLSKLSPR